MIRKKLVLGLVLGVVMPALPAQPLLRVTNRDLAVAGATAGVITVGSYIFYRLSNNYKIQSAKQQLQKHKANFLELHNKYEPYVKDCIQNSFVLADPAYLLRQVDSLNSKGMQWFFNDLRNDISTSKNIQNELEKLQLTYKDNIQVGDGAAKLLHESVRPDIEKLTSFSAYIYDHLGYFLLEKTYWEEVVHFKQELLVGASKFTAQQVISFAKTSSLAIDKTYPYIHYATHILKHLTKLEQAIIDFEKTEGLNKSVKFYTDSLRLVEVLTSIKNILVSLPDYASQFIEYEEARRKEALVITERQKADAAAKQAQAALQQAEVEKRKAEIAKNQLQEDTKANMLKEKLIKQREKTIAKIDEIQYAVKNLSPYNPFIRSRIEELQKSLQVVKNQLSEK